MQVRSPPLKRRSTFPPPDLLTDHSNSGSDEDQTMDMDLDDHMEMDSPMLDKEDFDPNAGFNYGDSGTGGFGFGPGAEEDGMVDGVNVEHQQAQPS